MGNKEQWFALSPEDIAELEALKAEIEPIVEAIAAVVKAHNEQEIVVPEEE